MMHPQQISDCAGARQAECQDETLRESEEHLGFRRISNREVHLDAWGDDPKSWVIDGFVTEVRAEGYGFRKSTLSATGAFARIVVVIRRSPKSGFLKTISCVPRGS